MIVTLAFQGVPDAKCEALNGSSATSLNCDRPAVATVTHPMTTYRVCELHARLTEDRELTWLGGTSTPARLPCARKLIELDSDRPSPAKLAADESHCAR